MVPSGIDAVAGVTVMEVRVGPEAMTVRIVWGEVIEPDVAEMLAVPGATPLASPLVPAALLIGATFAVSELHVTKLVRFWLLPSA